MIFKEEKEEVLDQSDKSNAIIINSSDQLDIINADSS